MGEETQARRKKQYGQLRLSEKVIGVLALVVLGGWIAALTSRGESAPATEFPWFATASIVGCVLVLILIVLKLNCLEFFPAKVQERLLPIVSLLPAIGFLIEELSGVESLMTVGGAMMLAYISATSYWRNYFPGFITNPLGVEDSNTPTKPENTAAADERAL